MIGEIVCRLDVVDSTNLFLNKALKNNSLQEGYVVLTNEQTSGRGQFGNSWESAKGKNLTMSFLLYPGFLNIDNQFLLSKFVSLAICDVLSSLVDNVKIKWPNDIYVSDRKIAGVLIENTLRGATIASTIVGIGLNINQTQFSSTLPNPTSLKMQTGEDISIDGFLQDLFIKLDSWYWKLQQRNDQLIDKEYISRLYRFGEFFQYIDQKGEFSAKITDVAQNGMLCLLDSTNVSRKYAFKEIQFV